MKSFIYVYLAVAVLAATVSSASINSGKALEEAFRGKTAMFENEVADLTARFGNLKPLKVDRSSATKIETEVEQPNAPTHATSRFRKIYGKRPAEDSQEPVRYARSRD